ncbi:MAG: hypothetical protein WBR13_09865 [Allosphingosinicella sp.]
MLFNRIKSYRRSELLTALLAILLIGALIAVAVCYPRATRPLVAEHQRVLVERAQRDAAVFFGGKSTGIKENSFAVVMRLSDRTCVELKPLRRGNGGYLACYDERSGRIVEELAHSADFGI